MKNSITRTCALLVVALAVLSGCSSHCTCPPPAPAPATTIIHEPANNGYNNGY